MPTLQQLKYVVAVAEKGSMNEAAKHLFIAQPTLSSAIRELEAEIGLSIFSRTNKGVVVSQAGIEFLGYARQVLEQMKLLEEKYISDTPSQVKFTVSTQHYAFAVSAFVDLIQAYGGDEYKFCLKETRTYEIISDVKNLTSEIGILYLNAFNEKVIRKLLKESNALFHSLFIAKPHVFISRNNPLAAKPKVTLNDLETYPYLSYEQGDYNSLYFSEEILSTLEHKRSIIVSDRATLFNLLIGLNGYTICTGVISETLNGKDIVAVPLDVDEEIHVGYITHQNVHLGRISEAYIQNLRRHVQVLL